jgi:hypothetical protein
MAAPAAKAASPLKTVAIPNEHGGWGFLFEPILLGLLIAPSGAGGWLALAAIGVFLSRHPLRLALNDRRRGKRYPRTQLAERVAGAYLLVGGVAFVLAVLAAPLAFLLPMAVAAPFAAVQLYFDARNRSRELAPELLGAVALAATAPAIVISGGVGLGLAFALWGILAWRAVASILYVRARLRLERGEPAPAVVPLAAHALGAVALLVAAVAGLLPWLAALAAIALTMRAAWGLSDRRRRVRASIVGVQEISYGLLLVFLVAGGVSWGL